MFYNFAGFMEIGSGGQLDLVFDGRADSLFYTKAQNHASLSKLYVQHLKSEQFIHVKVTSYPTFCIVSCLEPLS